MYKIEIKIKPIEIENIMDTLIKSPYFTTNDNKLVRQVGMNLRQLRKNKQLVIANDQRTGESVLFLRKSPSARPDSVLKIKGRRCVYQFEDNFFL